MAVTRFPGSAARRSGPLMGTGMPPTSVCGSGRMPTDEPDAKYRDTHVWYDADNKDEFGGLQAPHRRCDRREAEGRAPRV